MAYDCSNIRFILLIVAELLYYLKIIIPILLIILVIFDLVKVIVGQVDEKAKKDMTGKIVKRLIYGVIIFLIPTLINFIFITIDKYITKDGSATSWVSCWTQVYK